MYERKQCSKCGEIKPAKEFGKRNNRKSGLTSHCRLCLKKEHRERYYRPEIRQEISLKNKELYNDPIFRKKVAIRSSKYYLDVIKPFKQTMNGLAKTMFDRSRQRAFIRNVGHNISKEDILKLIIETEFCPICNCKIDYTPNKGRHNRYSPSLDSVEPDKGYINNNIVILCSHCNLVKNDGSADLHRKIADFIDRYINSNKIPNSDNSFATI